MIRPRPKLLWSRALGHGANAAMDAAMVAVHDVSLGNMIVANSVGLIACNGAQPTVAA